MDTEDSEFYRFFGAVALVLGVLLAFGIFMSVTSAGKEDQECKESYGSEWFYSPKAYGCVRSISGGN